MNRKPQSSEPEHYEIIIAGHLDARRSRWFEGMTLANLPDGNTALRGPLPDQTALHGILNRIRDLGLPLISVRRSGSPDNDLQQEQNKE